MASKRKTLEAELPINSSKIVRSDAASYWVQVELETLLARKQGDQRREVLRSTQLAEAGVEAESRVRC